MQKKGPTKKKDVNEKKLGWFIVHIYNISTSSLLILFVNR
jgi:hypothetical protein